jgi:hypothetical protein
MRQVLPHLLGPASVLVLVRLMHGATACAGRHTLVYTYNPASFRIGGGVSLATVAIVTMAGLGHAYGEAIRRRRGSAP